MKKFSHILVIIEPKRDIQVALKRAIEIAKYNPNVTITALRLVYDYSYELNIVNRKKEHQLKDDEYNAHVENLNQIIREYQKDDIYINPLVLFAKDLGEGILKELNNAKYDLLIKSANNHGILDSIIFTPLDWFLLRNSTIPVIIAKDVKWEENDNIVVALDFSTAEKKVTNIRLLREAQSLATITKANIHLVNSAPILLPTVMLEVPNYAPEFYSKNIIEDHKNRLYDFAKMHNIPEERCHIIEGMPDDAIPHICKSLNAKTVFIGSSGRQGVAAAFIGNTCEEIVDYINADLVVLNHKTITKNN